jgi:hypothetical protein
MFFLELIAHPVNKMIFECSLDHLMQQVWCDEFMNVRAWKMGGKRLVREIRMALQLEHSKNLLRRY